MTVMMPTIASGWRCSAARVALPADYSVSGVVCLIGDLGDLGGALSTKEIENDLDGKI